ncbi:MAG TPA: MBL fold metallo-hydrolase [Nanoarchaeota archaeon]|nr:MBL fold metallo-hydrolase [Nanoarchaeota archaeon]
MEIEGLNIIHFGHSSFLVEGTKRVYIDPYVLPAEPKKADIILVTHEHFDHFDRARIAEVRAAKTDIVIPPACASGLDGKFRVIRENETIDIEGIKITAVPAYNINKFRMGKIPYHAKGEGYGYIIEMGGKRVYHAGDTDFTDEMKTIKADIVMLPIGGTFTMDAEEAAKAANAIKPDVVIPMHYNTTEHIKADVNEFIKLVNKSIKVVVNPQ